MIPLLRPIFPYMGIVTQAFQHAIASKMFSNFGSLHERATDLLSKVTGGYALPVSSGTTAIEVALRSLRLPPGARVLMPDFTHSGTLLAVVRAGLTPVLMAVDDVTWQLNIELVDREDNFRAVIVVSPFGYDVPVRGWDAWAAKRGIPLVYDFAGAFGNFPQTDHPVCYSFHATKNFGVGEGGMVVFANAGQRIDAKRLINFGTLPDRDIEGVDGFNGKVDELHAACIIAGLDEKHRERVADRIENKRCLINLYHDQIDGAEVPPGYHTPSMCVIGNLPAKVLEAASEKVGVTFKRYYPLLSRMPGLAAVERVSVSSDAMERCCALPSDVDLSQALHVINVVNNHIP